MTDASNTWHDWIALAPLYVIREAHARGVAVSVPQSVVVSLSKCGYLDVLPTVIRDGTGAETRGEVYAITHAGRRALNLWLDEIGLQPTAIRAAVRRAVREFGLPPPAEPRAPTD